LIEEKVNIIDAQRIENIRKIGGIILESKCLMKCSY